MKKIILISVIIILSLFSSCSDAGSEPDSITGFFFDTVITITVYDDCPSDLLVSCMELCREYEHYFSRTLTDSDISKINMGIEGFSPSEITMDLINKGFRYCVLTDGALDITLAPITSLWDFTSGSGKVPPAENITDALSKTGYEKIISPKEYKAANPAVKITPEMIVSSGVNIDTGAIAKGFIADKLKSFLLNNNVKSALIDLGGNILCVGSKPDGSPFTVGVRKPFSETDELIITLPINNRSVVSSGVYERYFYQDDTLYHHIIDASTGYPVKNDLLSVTIVSDESFDGDALSTACFVMGKEKGIEFINSLENVTAYFVDTDYKVTCSDNP